MTVLLNKALPLYLDNGRVPLLVGIHDKFDARVRLFRTMRGLEDAGFRFPDVIPASDNDEIAIAACELFNDCCDMIAIGRAVEDETLEQALKEIEAYYYNVIAKR